MSSIEQQSSPVHLGERSNENGSNTPTQQEDRHDELNLAITADVKVPRNLCECGHHHGRGAGDNEPVARNNDSDRPFLAR